MRRFHSLSGALPLGLFLLGHLWAQGRALLGQTSYQATVDFALPAKLWIVVEVLLVYVPLLFHAGYGISILKQRPRGLGRQPYRESWAWWLQRVSGVITLIFIGFHVWQFRWQVWTGHMTEQDFFPVLCTTLSATNAWGVPVAAFGYLLGSTACIVHFCNGLSGCLFYWNITRTRRSSARASLGLGALGFALFAYTSAAIVYFATGSTPLDSLR
jgi:succinate dehydrogenase/fumarate reductase cytochrome b subunit (b558 family)